MQNEKDKKRVKQVRSRLSRIPSPLFSHQSDLNEVGQWIHLVLDFALFAEGGGGGRGAGVGMDTCRSRRWTELLLAVAGQEVSGQLAGPSLTIERRTWPVTLPTGV
ncbi:hypothetical protein RRG08_062336 [Elysia crispata]|uniref:Uncharacterized protein n=1 Tax=Elysia crispata TaxID=231223 RepID=A0AAE0YG65_9GAST|nr:hypothetical protein RRG08_062336 [Elysia crispata]